MKRTYQSLIALSLLFSLACQDQSATEAEASQESESLFSISKAAFHENEMSLVQSETVSLNKKISCNGVIDLPPQNRAVMSAVLGGYVEEIKLLEGSPVKKGEVLLYLSNPAYLEMQERYLKAEAEVLYLEKEYARQKALQEEKVNAVKDLQSTERELQQAKAQKQSLEKRLALIGINAAQLQADALVSKVGIRAPIDGTVADIAVSQGSYVSPNDPLLSILNTDHLHLELDVFEQDLPQIKKGQQIAFKLSEYGKKELKGEVYLIGKQLDPEKRTVRVHGHIEDLDSATLAVGMFVEAQILSDEQIYPAVPQAAAYELEDQWFVLALADSTNEAMLFERIAVKQVAEHKGMQLIEVEGQEMPKALLAGAYHFLGESEGGE